MIIDVLSVVAKRSLMRVLIIDFTQNIGVVIIASSMELYVIALFCVHSLLVGTEPTVRSIRYFNGQKNWVASTPVTCYKALNRLVFWIISIIPGQITKSSGNRLMFDCK